MIHKNILISCLLLFSLFFTGCSERETKPVSIEDIIANLESNGYKIEIVDPSPADKSTSFFSMSSFKYLYVNSSKEAGIVIYSFDSEETARQQANTISKDGNKVGNSFIGWVTPQTFFLKDNLIVRCNRYGSYTKQLEKLLGKRITD